MAMAGKRLTLRYMDLGATGKITPMQRYVCADGPQQGKIDKTMAPVELLQFPVEGGWYRPKQPPTYQDIRCDSSSLPD